ncbi:glutamate receptor ionotropic, NMDA 1-like isoform X2 [Actinia tenebrosa]|nr:glutamate receptor ionotropic, NMDA 1-like isoform X2 [Actinia tenebrosa]
MIHLSSQSSIKDKAASIAPILNKLSWKKIILMHDNSIENMQITANFERSFPLNNILMLNSSMVTNETSLEKLILEFTEMKKLGSSFAVLTNDQVIVDNILTAASQLDMLGPAFTWIMFNELERNYIPSYLVPYVLLIVGPANHKWKSHDLIRDSVFLIAKGLDRISKIEEKQKCSCRCDCEPFTSQLFRCIQQVEFQGTSGLIKFDETGQRRYAKSYIRVITQMEDKISQEIIGEWDGKTVFIQEQKSYPKLRALINEYPPNIMALPKLKEKTCPSSAHICMKGIQLSGGKMITKEYCCYGFAIDVLNLIKEEVGFDPELQFSKDGQYGVFDTENGSWNGIVGELLRGEGDITLDLYVSARRSNVLDFTEPYAPSGIRLLVKENSGKKSEIYWLSYLRPFTSSVWLTLLGSVGVMIVFLWIVEKFAPHRYPAKIQEEVTMDSEDNDKELLQKFIPVNQISDYDYFEPKENTLDEEKIDEQQDIQPDMYGSFGLDNAVCYTLALAFGRPADEAKPLLNGARLASVAFGVAMLMLVSSYSANLAAFLIVDDKYTSVTSIYDDKIAHPPPGFRYGTVKGSYMADFFSNSENAYMRSMWYNMKKHNVDTVTGGVEKVRNGELDVLIADHISLQYESLNDPSCRLKVVGDPFAMSGAAIAVKKGSPWFPKFNAVLQKLKSKGLTDFIQKFWISKYKCVNEKPPSQLKIQDLSGLFLQLAIAVIACSFGTFLHNIISFLAHAYKTHKPRGNSIITNTNTMGSQRDKRKTNFRTTDCVETDV